MGDPPVSSALTLLKSSLPTVPALPSPPASPTGPYLTCSVISWTLAHQPVSKHQPQYHQSPQSLPCQDSWPTSRQATAQELLSRPYMSRLTVFLRHLGPLIRPTWFGPLLAGCQQLWDTPLDCAVAISGTGPTTSRQTLGPCRTPGPTATHLNPSSSNHWAMAFHSQPPCGLLTHQWLVASEQGRDWQSTEERANPAKSTGQPTVLSPRQQKDTHIALSRGNTRAYSTGDQRGMCCYGSPYSLHFWTHLLYRLC